ncbi:MAG TPA: CARDB domain-containing protein [Thermoleophilaceae bacterium]|nr:CARDB domain-containing protein [Thermoleophilaceae bacterium]
MARIPIEKCALFAATVCAALLAAPAAVAAGGPDLVVGAVQNPPAKLSVLARLSLRDTTKNKGKRAAAASQTAYFLSTDRKQSVDDIPLGARKVRGLRAGKSKAGSLRVKVPAVAAGGRYYLLACADGQGKVQESSEKDNCRASSKKLKVNAGAIPKRGYFPRRSHSRTVTPALDSAHAVSSLVTSAGGGTLTATGANGTHYTLAIPAGALASDQTITMTPVSSVAGSPLGNLVGAVQLTPGGLQLLKSATLTIVPPTTVNVKNVAGFNAYEGGQDFGLYPLDRGRGIVMSLHHFSTDGVADATAAQVRVSLLLMPSRPQAQWQQISANTLRSRNVAAFALVAVAYYRDVVQPLVDKALTDDSYAESAVGELDGWSRAIQDLGFEGNQYVKPLVEGVPKLYTDILLNAANQRYKRCLQKNDLSEIVRLLAAEREAAVLGVNLGAAADFGSKCAHFELDVTTTAEEKQLTGDNELMADIGVEDDLPIAAGGALGLYTGEASPKYTNWQVSLKYGGSRPTSGTFVDEPSKVNFVLNYNIVEQKDPQTGQIRRWVPEPSLALDFNPGKTRELYSGLTFTVWNNVWRFGHAAERVAAPDPALDLDSYVLDNWQTFPPGSGPLVAMKSYPTRTYCRSAAPGCTQSADMITETTTLKLYHRPQP